MSRELPSGVIRQLIPGDVVYMFIDTSGSTRDIERYWSLVNQIYQMLISQGFCIKFIFWNDTTKEVSEEDFLQAVKKLEGRGGTEISSVAKFLVGNNIHSNIILVTDGEVHEGEVKNANKILEKYDIKYVICFVITDRKTTANMSVTCPFTRDIHAVHIMKEGVSVDTRVVTPGEVGLLGQIKKLDLEEFHKVYEQLVKLLIAKHMGLDKGDQVIKDSILSLRKRLTHEELSTKKDFGVLIQKALIDNNLELAVLIANQMVENFKHNLSGVTKKLDYLMSLCGNMERHYTVDQVKSSRVIRAVDVKEVTNPEEIKDAPLTVECPITYDASVPQILVIEGPCVFSKIETQEIDTILNNPLAAVQHRGLIIKLIGHNVGVSEEMNAHLADEKIDPFTRQPIMGSIPLGSSPQHVACGNTALAKMFTGGKLAGNMDLYFAVIWYLIVTDKIEYLSDVKEAATEHLKYRLSQHYTSASLSGNSAFINTKVPTDVAIWFCVHSCLFDKNIMNAHLYNLDIMVEILKVLNYPVNQDVLVTIRQTKALNKMLSMVKTDEYAFKISIWRLFQRAIKVGDTWIFIDGPAIPEQSKEALDELYSQHPIFASISVAELVAFANTVNPNMKVSDLVIPEVGEVFPAVNWCYGLEPVTSEALVINSATLRPSTLFKGKTMTGAEIVAKRYNGRQMSSYKLWLDYYMVHGAFPTYGQYLVYCFKVYECQHLTEICTLPHEIELFYTDIVASYTPIVEMIEKEKWSVDHVKGMIEKSRPFEERCCIESGLTQ